MAKVTVTASWGCDFQDPGLKAWRIYASTLETERGTLVATAAPDARSVEFDIEEGDYHFTAVAVTNADVEEDWSKAAARTKHFITGRSQTAPSAPTSVAIQPVSPDVGARVTVDPLPPGEDGDRLQIIEGIDEYRGKLVAEVPMPRQGPTQESSRLPSNLFALDGSSQGENRTLHVRAITKGGKAGASASQTIPMPERAAMEGVLVAAVDISGLTKTNFPTPTGSDFFTYVAADGFKTARLPALNDAAGWNLLGAVGTGTRFTSMPFSPYPKTVKIESDEVDLGASVVAILECYDEVQRVTSTGLLPSKPAWSLSSYKVAPSVDRTIADANADGPAWLFRSISAEGKPRHPVRGARWEYVSSASTPVAHAEADYKPIVPGAWISGRYVRVRLVITEPVGWHQVKTGNIRVYARIQRVIRTDATEPEASASGPPGSLHVGTHHGEVQTKKSGQGSTGWSDAMRPVRAPGFYARWVEFENLLNGTPFLESSSGVSAAISAGAFASGDGSRIGLVAAAKGTDSTGRSGAIMAAACMRLGNGEATFECDLKLGALSDATNEYIVRIGFLDTIAADAVDGAYLIYDRLTSANWIMGTASNSTRTATASSVAVAAGSWIRLKIVVNAAGTSVEYFVNGVSLGTVTTNIPTGSGRETSVGFWIVGSAGTANRSFLLDFVNLLVKLTTSR